MTGARKIKSAERTLALFELFSHEQQPCTVGTIRRALGIPQSSASMLVRNLQEIGYLEYDPHARTYAPSIRVALLGSWIDRRFGDARAIGERLEELQRRVGLTAYVGIQNAAAAQYILTLSSKEPDRLDVSSGAYSSLTCSAMGRILLSRMSDLEVLSWVRRCNAEAPSEHLRVRESEFLEDIRQVRSQGFAEAGYEHARGVVAVAVSFDSPMGGAPLAVGVGGAARRVESEREAILDALQEFTSTFKRAPSVLLTPTFGRGTDVEENRRSNGWRSTTASRDLGIWTEQRRANGAG